MMQWHAEGAPVFPRRQYFSTLTRAKTPPQACTGPRSSRPRGLLGTTADDGDFLGRALAQIDCRVHAIGLRAHHDILLEEIHGLRRCLRFFFAARCFFLCWAGARARAAGIQLATPDTRYHQKPPRLLLICCISRIRCGVTAPLSPAINAAASSPPLISYVYYH